MTRPTEIDARRTGRELRGCFLRWPDAELVSIPERVDEAAEVVFDYRGTRVRLKEAGSASYRDNLRASVEKMAEVNAAYEAVKGDA